MAKRRKKKNKKRGKGKHKYMLTRANFMSTFCKNCDICSIRSQADFCYDAMYKHNPQAFIKHAWPQLRLGQDWPIKALAKEYFFEQVFCRSGACDALKDPCNLHCSCPHLDNCVDVFEQQVIPETLFDGYGLDDYNDYNTYASCGWDSYHGHLGQRNSNRYGRQKMAKATPQFITNADGAWAKHMKKVLNGNNHI